MEADFRRTSQRNPSQSLGNRISKGPLCPGGKKRSNPLAAVNVTSFISKTNNCWRAGRMFVPTMRLLIKSVGVNYVADSYMKHNSLVPLFPFQDSSTFCLSVFTSESLSWNTAILASAPARFNRRIIALWQYFALHRKYVQVAVEVVTNDHRVYL